MQYSTTHDNDDDSDDEAIPSRHSRKNSNATQGAGDTGAVGSVQAPSPKMTPRRGSLQTSPKISDSRRADSMSNESESTRKVSPSVHTSQKRATSPRQDRVSDSPKFLKHEHGSRETSDVRSSPHQSTRLRHEDSATGSHQSMQEYSSTHMASPMVPPPQQMYSPQVGMSSGPSYVPHQVHRFQSSGPQLQTQGGGGPYQRPEYPGPQYEPPQNQSNTRQLPMAPPLTIPVMPQSSHHQQHQQHQQQQQQHEQQQQQQQQAQLEAQRGQPLLPPGASNVGPSRILLPGEGGGGGFGLTPIESPSNFASSLYGPGISTIGTNITIPRISTDVGSLFYNWNTNEPGLSPATSMMLNQFRETDGAGSSSHSGGGGGGNNTQQPLQGRSQLSGPPISAGVLENFSPTTAQWLSGHGIPPPPPQSQVAGEKP